MKTVSAGSLPSFLREHYTTSIDMAKQLSGFLISNGAADTRAQPKQPKDAKLDSKPVKPEAEPRQAVFFEKAFVDGGMLLHPQVSVLVTNAAGQDVSVMGEVARPGVLKSLT